MVKCSMEKPSSASHLMIGFRDKGKCFVPLIWTLVAFKAKHAKAKCRWSWLPLLSVHFEFSQKEHYNPSSDGLNRCLTNRPFSLTLSLALYLLMCCCCFFSISIMLSFVFFGKVRTAKGQELKQSNRDEIVGKQNTQRISVYGPNLHKHFKRV